MERHAILLELFEKLNLTLDISSFEKRKRIQKIVYLLKLHKELRPFLAHYKFSIYLHGPYSPDLALDYYNVSDYGREYSKGSELINISDESISYAKFIMSLSTKELEILTTVIELIKHHGTTDINKLTWLMKGLKPKVSKAEVQQALKTLEEIKKTFNISISGDIN